MSIYISSKFYPNNASENALASKSCKSSIFSPTPINLTGTSGATYNLDELSTTNTRTNSTEKLIVQIWDGPKLHTIFTVSHYPHCDGQFVGSFNLHGHLHTPKNLDEYTGSDANTARKLKEKGMCYDVGVDGNDYKPVKLTDVLTGNLIMYQLSPDHVNFQKWKEIINNKYVG